MKSKESHNTIRAIFQGRDGSLGYRHNRVYELSISKNEEGQLLVTTEQNRDGSCFYKTEKALLMNWMTTRKVLYEKVGHPTIKAQLIRDYFV